MVAINIHELELVEGWAEDDETVRARFSFPITAASGAASTSVVYFEVEPGHRLSPHTHTAEEVLLILEGTAEAILGEPATTLDAGGMTVIPANVLHNVANPGSDTLRAVGFFSSAATVNTYEHLIMPMGARVLVFPQPAEIPAESKGSQ
jgi:quercetin dioxygenase-like cupin family protein